MEFKQEAAPNVVTEPRFRELLSLGYDTEILCLEDCNKRSGHWYGEWIMRAISRDGTSDKLLVKVPRHAHLDVEARTFKTVNGLISFMLDLGFATANIPVRKGHRALNSLANELTENATTDEI